MRRGGTALRKFGFRESFDTPYIDALRRIVVGMQRSVRHPANLVVSLEPGYHFGDPAADLLVDVTGTHGSLRTGSSVAFFMSTHVQAPPVLGSRDLLRYLSPSSHEGRPTE